MVEERHWLISLNTYQTHPCSFDEMVDSNQDYLDLLLLRFALGTKGKAIFEPAEHRCTGESKTKHSSSSCKTSTICSGLMLSLGFVISRKTDHGTWNTIYLISESRILIGACDILDVISRAENFAQSKKRHHPLKALARRTGSMVRPDFSSIPSSDTITSVKTESVSPGPTFLTFSPHIRLCLALNMLSIVTLAVPHRPSILRRRAFRGGEARPWV